MWYVIMTRKNLLPISYRFPSFIAACRFTHAIQELGYPPIVGRPTITKTPHKELRKCGM